VFGVTTVVSAWVGRRWRRLWWTAAVFSALAHFLGAPISFESVVALFAGWTAGAAVVVVLGAPSRRPTRDAVVEGLRAVGVDVARLEPASVDARGSTPYFGELGDGDAVFVKTLGADERSADLLFRLYRRVQPRDLHDERPFSSLRRAVEHEALVALTARDAGVRTPHLLAVATAHPNGFTLAYEAVAGGSLDRQAQDDVTDAVLSQVWDQLAVLRRHRVAHRDLRLANVFLDAAGDAWLIDFGFSELAVDDTLLAGDVAELLASSSTVVGVERAVAVALDRVGPDAVASAGSRLRPALLSGATRSALKERPELLAELRAACGQAQ
jgi:undecaprenyl-diphosphatase